MITEQEYQRYLTDIIDSWPKLDVSLAGGIRKGELICATASRLTGKSVFQGMILCHEQPAPINYDWIVVDEWKRKWFSNCILMKTSSKQCRYIRVWRNK